MASSSTHCIRAFELNETIQLIPAACNLLEIGGGDGWQANQLVARCKNVHAIDIATHKKHEVIFFPVTYYDGLNIPFDTNFFDVVYSSNVLEHVTEFGKLSEDMHRVLQPKGLAIHCVPSATWRFWTSIGHPIYVARILLKLITSKIINRGITDYKVPEEKIIARTSWLELLRLAFIPPRHGEHGNVFSETWLFSYWHWAKHFEKHNWEVITHKHSGIFYTGNEIFGLNMSNQKRALLATIFGSSTHIFVLKKSGLAQRARILIRN